jgi:rhodanese-related sulfurtransferase
MVNRVLLLMGMLLSLKSCAQSAFEQQLRLLYKNTVPVIAPEALYKLLQTKNKIYLLDARSPREFQVSHLPGARFVNYETFATRQVQDIPKDAPVVVYCAVGVRSERVGEQLQKMGYQQVQNLYGGIFQWKNKGFPVYNIKLQLTDSVHTYNRYWSLWLKNGKKVYE